MKKTTAIIKKTVCFLLASVILNLNTSALALTADFTVDKDFVTYSIGEDKTEITEILGLSEEELYTYCVQNGIVKLAVNKDNTKQIRAEVTQSPFSEGVENLSDLSDSRITEIMPDITGDKAVTGEILNKNGQKFVRVHISTSDSGGEYKVMRYITVAAQKEYTLTFYTEKNTSEDYCQSVFESFNSNDFQKQNSDQSAYIYIIITAIIVLAALAVYVVITIIKDIKAEKTAP